MKPVGTCSIFLPDFRYALTSASMDLRISWVEILESAFFFGRLIEYLNSTVDGHDDGAPYQKLVSNERNIATPSQWRQGPTAGPYPRNGQVDYRLGLRIA